MASKIIIQVGAPATGKTVRAKAWQERKPGRRAVLDEASPLAGLAEARLLVRKGFEVVVNMLPDQRIDTLSGDDFIVNRDGEPLPL